MGGSKKGRRKRGKNWKRVEACALEE